MTTITITKKQVELCHAISHQIDRSRGQYRDLLALAAREVGMTVTEAILQLDGLGEVVDASEETWPEGALTKIVFAQDHLYVRENVPEVIDAFKNAKLELGRWALLTRAEDRDERAVNPNLVRSIVGRP